MRPLLIAFFSLPILSAITPSNAALRPLPSCSQGTAFTLSSISYSSYIVSPNASFPDQTPSTLTISFSVTNNATGVQTACSFSHDLSFQDGAWNVDSTVWHACGERTISWDAGKGGSSFEVETMASFEWSSWVVGVQQTWVCKDGVGMLIERNGTASATIVPVCSSTSTGSSTSEECTAPDTVVFATLV